MDLKEIGWEGWTGLILLRVRTCSWLAWTL
jgi:hypothetical protein